MLKEIVSKPLEIKADLDGISLKAIAEHFKLYEGYVKKTNEIRGKVALADKSAPNPTYSEIGELKRQESFALNGVKLHEIYFGILSPSNADTDGSHEPFGPVLEKIIKDFNSFEAWKEDMISAGLSARGWVILSYDLADESLHNYSADAHNLGIIAGTIPLVTLDVYEHAYFMDYGTNRKSYIEAFFKNLNWEKINENFNKISR